MRKDIGQTERFLQDLFGIDLVLPEQFYPGADTLSPVSGERALMWAVLTDGIERYRRTAHSRAKHEVEEFKEVEAWLLAEGDCLAKRLKDTNIKPDRNAEAKNLDNPPSKRIDALFKNRRHGDGYHKINDGTPLFQCLQFQPVYDTCQYFREFYDELKSVGSSALNL